MYMRKEIDVQREKETDVWRGRYVDRYIYMKKEIDVQRVIDGWIERYT